MDVHAILNRGIIEDEFEITPESFLELSKSTVVPAGLRCEQVLPSGNGRECGAVLSCWLAYSHHLAHAHSITVTESKARKRGKGKARPPQTYHRCKVSRCTFPNQNFSNRRELQEHVKTAHMAHIRALQCPISGCPQQPFSRPHTIQEHLGNHHELIGQKYRRDMPVFYPSWMPSRGQSIPPPPPLPESLEPGSVILSIIPGVIRNRPAPTTPPRSSDSVTPRSPQKQQLTTTFTPAPSIRESTADHTDYNFDDLPRVPAQEDTPLEDALVWKRPESMQKDVARGQAVLSPEEIQHKPAETSIYFEALRRRVEGLDKEVAAKLQAGAGSSATKASSSRKKQ